jgi:hypothetical protein
MTNKQLVEEFLAQSKSYNKCNSIYYEGDTLYSYGRHFKLAILNGTTIQINTRKYSPTTSKHTFLVKCLSTHLEQIFTTI